MNTSATPESEATGLECPKCGCRHLEPTTNPNYRTCRYCGRRMKYVYEGVTYLPLRTRCPACKSAKTWTIHSKIGDPVRYHKCECGCNFKSVEDAA